MRRLAAQPRLCPQFHLALQSGCDATLRRMNRHYDTAAYRRIAGRLREAFPGCALTTDVMVGFPGEDEEEFAQSLAFVEAVGFSRLHVFAYSRRPGTPAAKAPGQLSAAVKAERSRQMTALGDRLRDAYAAAQVGSTAAVLLETRREDGLAEGYAPNYLPVRVRTARPLGSCLDVRITGHENGVCLGEEAD